jgi:CBS-domain-containing membrane protein
MYATAVQQIHRDRHPASELTAAAVMSAPIVTVSVRETLWDAWGLLYRSGFRHLVVLDGSRCVGVLDDRRIALEWPLGDVRSLGHGRVVGDILHGRARCVLAGTPVSDLARIMLDQHLDALPVVTSKGDVVGLVSASDLIAVLTIPAVAPSAGAD